MMPGRTAFTRTPSAATSRQAEREAVDRTLGRGVVDVLARCSELGRGRRQVDDGAAAAAVFRAHAAHRLARADQRADDVDVEHAAPARDAHLVDARSDVDDAGVVHQPVQHAELAVDGGEHRQHLGFVGDVGAHRHRAPAQRAHGRGHGLGRGLVARVVDGHVPTGARAEQRARGADTAAAARDEKDSVHAPMLVRSRLG
jgi:hypothetical protein